MASPSYCTGGAHAKGETGKAGGGGTEAADRGVAGEAGAAEGGGIARGGAEAEEAAIAVG